ncbi:MAG TPA: type I polyketide synthase, partial [Solirubrobacterales bacterium]|nr:type I polyketide synthase [Solirubrobacterales bacterium]
VLGSLRREEDDARRFALSLAAAHAAGAAVEWEAFFAPAAPKRVALPTYPFQRERFWLDSAADDLAGEEAPALDRLRYRDRWDPIADPPTASLRGTWTLVVSPWQRDDPGIAAVEEALSGACADLARVELDPGRAAVGDLMAQLPTDVEGVLSMVALDQGPDSSPSGGGSALTATEALVAALADAGLAPSLWLATSGVVSVTASDAVTHPEQAPVWGLGKTLGLEQPRCLGGLVDLPEPLDARAAERLVGLLGRTEGEDQVAIRDGGVFARRLVRAPSSCGPPAQPWAPRGTVLVTGAAGSSGAEVVRWLGHAGAKHILLAVDPGQGAEELEALDAALGEMSVDVSVAPCDLTDREQVQALLASASGDDPLDAVFHLAGVGEDAATTAIAGARHLHELTRDLDLSAFVLLASIAATFGSLGRAPVAAAGAYLEALAQQRRTLGLPATVVAWGPWAGAGDLQAESELERHGVRPLEPRVALAGMRQMLDEGETALVIADLDWESFAPAFAAARPRPLLAALPEAGRALGEGSTAREDADAGALALKLTGIADQDQLGVVLELVRGEVAAVLGHDAPARVEPDRAFKDLGFDSLAAVELRRRLVIAAGMNLPAGVVFNHPTALAMAEHLHERARGVVERGGGIATAVAHVEPIAILGMACRYPGGVDSPRGLWELVASGADGIAEFPDDRGWDLERL